MPLMDIRNAALAAAAVIGVALMVAPASAAPQDKKDNRQAQRSLERVEPVRTAQSQPRAVQPQSSRSGGRSGDHSGNRGDRSGSRRGGDHSGNRGSRQHRGDRSGSRRGGDRSGNRGSRQHRGDRSGGRRGGDHSGNRGGRQHRGNRSGGRRHDSYRGGRRHDSYGRGYSRDHRRANRRHYRSGAYSQPRYYGGRQYGHGYGPRRGYGYFCSDHNILHYGSGYDPLGWLFASFGRDQYSSGYVGNCDVVSKKFYRRGDEYTETALLCYDAWGYGYIKRGSRRVYNGY